MKLKVSLPFLQHAATGPCPEHITFKIHFNIIRPYVCWYPKRYNRLVSALNENQNHYG